MGHSLAEDASQVQNGGGSQGPPQPPGGVCSGSGSPVVSPRAPEPGSPGRGCTDAAWPTGDGGATLRRHPRAPQPGGCPRMPWERLGSFDRRSRTHKPGPRGAGRELRSCTPIATSTTGTCSSQTTSSARIKPWRRGATSGACFGLRAQSDWSVWVPVAESSVRIGCVWEVSMLPSSAHHHGQNTGVSVQRAL